MPKVNSHPLEVLQYFDLSKLLHMPKLRQPKVQLSNSPCCSASMWNVLATQTSSRHVSGAVGMLIRTQDSTPPCSAQDAGLLGRLVSSRFPLHVYTHTNAWQNPLPRDPPGFSVYPLKEVKAPFRLLYLQGLTQLEEHILFR